MDKGIPNTAIMQVRGSKEDFPSISWEGVAIGLRVEKAQG